jgi:dephospho-CoA kinase
VIRVGLTGGIACGKSYVRARLAAAGFHTIDLDAVAHAVMAPGGSAHADVVAAFGPGVVGPSGAIDRRVLGPIVFGDRAARRRLDAIVHPRVRDEEARLVADFAAAGASCVVTDAALLVETGQHARFDRLVVVHCPPAEQVRRLQQRDGLDAAAARARIAAQMSIDEKRAFGHFLVDTSGTFAATDTVVDQMAAQLGALRLSPSALPSVTRARAALGSARGPRGLDAARVLGAIASSGFLDLHRVAALLDPPPPADVPWYRLAATSADTVPWTLAGAVAVWAAARGGDGPFVAAAAASLARLTHREAASISGACLVALALNDALGRAGAASGDLSALATRWGGAAPPWQAEEAAVAAVAALDGPAQVGSSVDAALGALGYA